MEIRTGLRLSQSEVLSLLNRFDDSSEKPIYTGIDFSTYSIKLSQYAYFIIASEKNDCQACPAPNHTEFQNEAACHPKSPLKKARPAPKELDGRGKSRCVSGLLP